MTDEIVELYLEMLLHSCKRELTGIVSKSISEIEQPDIVLKMREAHPVLDALSAAIGLCQRDSQCLNPKESQFLWFQLLDSFSEPLKNCTEAKIRAAGQDPTEDIYCSSDTFMCLPAGNNQVFPLFPKKVLFRQYEYSVLDMQPISNMIALAISFPHYEILNHLQRPQKSLHIETVPPLKLSLPAIYHEKIQKRTSLVGESSKHSDRTEKPQKIWQMKEPRLKKNQGTGFCQSQAYLIRTDN
ncbi:hypothetical protein GUJ93_ZPchr0002g24465 [Zizania palustris]|uniref:Uncharacterized protein n=1 Tax=Zizania palustris TaxID=103762 RepID=A0A8J5RNX3_ZIZPA|nr:hypothetical protein GUJ93_ZPchr0002g24465 [Zizania palustris]